MAKFGIGESVRFKAPELLVSTGGYSLKIGTDGLVGKVTCSVETTGEETKYYVEVKFPRGLPVSASGILGILAFDVTLKLDVLESQLQSEKEYSDSKLSRLSDLEFDEFVKRVIPFFNPDPDSWIRLDDGGPFVKESFDATLVLKKWKPIPDRYFMGVDLGRPEVVASFQPSKEVLDSLREFARTVNMHHADGLTSADGGKEETAKPMHSFFFSDSPFPIAKDIIEEYEKKFNENARNIMKGVDSAVPGGDKNGVSVVDGKMSKSRCVKLLESYRAEREKVKNGRKFERCLRDSVVDEALERAIELLKE